MVGTIPIYRVAVLVVCLGVLGGCRQNPPPPAAGGGGGGGAGPSATATAAPSRTFTSAKGARYAVARVGPSDNDEPIERPATGAAIAEAVSGDNFRGTARKAAKLSVAAGPVTTFNDLTDLLDSLPSDDQMLALGISEAANSGRVEQEQKNVTVTAFLYAASKEADNDWHCIVGRDPSQPPRFMNMEVSGLPPANAASRTALQNARQQFKDFFGNDLPQQGYDRYDPPIPIKVTGSLFFDVDHKAGAIGPRPLNPQTAWEVHPITDIQFEP